MIPNVHSRHAFGSQLSRRAEFLACSAQDMLSLGTSGPDLTVNPLRVHLTQTLTEPVTVHLSGKTAFADP